MGLRVASTSPQRKKARVLVQELSSRAAGKVGTISMAGFEFVLDLVKTASSSHSDH